MATVHANQILTLFMLLLGGHYHCVKASSDSKMGLWEFSGALRELMLNVMGKLSLKIAMRYWETLFQCISKYFFLFLRKCQNKSACVRKFLRCNDKSRDWQENYLRQMVFDLSEPSVFLFLPVDFEPLSLKFQL